MPKSVDVEDFAAKLGLLVKRLNWSRAKLAQQVGVDKSLVARWLNANSRPTGNSLMRITAVAGQVTGFTAADWDLPLAQFARRLGNETSPVARTQTRMTFAGLKNPPSENWRDPYLGTWAGFHQWFGPRGFIRVSASRFDVDALGARFTFMTGAYGGSGPVLAVHSHVSCLIELQTLANHFCFYSFNAVRDPLAMVLDGLQVAVGPDGTPAAVPIVMFRIDADGAGVPSDLDAFRPALTALNQRIEQEFARTGDPLAGVRALAPAEFLSGLFPKPEFFTPDGRIGHALRISAERSLSAGRVVFGGPRFAELQDVPGNLRLALGLGECVRMTAKA